MLPRMMYSPENKCIDISKYSMTIEKHVSCGVDVVVDHDGDMMMKMMKMMMMMMMILNALLL